MFYVDNKELRWKGRKFILFSLIIFYLFSAHPLISEQQKERSGQIVIAKEDEPSRFGLTLLPIIYYTPETKMAFGLGGLFTYRFGLLFKKARPSTLFIGVIYTQMKQFTLQLKPEIYLQNNSFFLTGNFLAQHFPTKLWGIGAETTEEEEESYTPRTYFLEVGLQKKFFQNLPVYFGFKYHLESTRIAEKEPNKLIDLGLVPGSQGGLLSGPGLILTYDNRDNIFSPSSGFYLQAIGFWNDRIFGSDFEYLSFKLDLRNYIRIKENQVLALQAIAETTSDEVPFYKMPMLGGDSLLRGYYQGRFRDNNLLAFQAEYRFPLWKRLSGVVFGAMGNLANKFNEFNWDTIKYAAGFGLRFKIIPKEKANLRVDLAFGPGSYGIYFKAGESF